MITPSIVSLINKKSFFKYIFFIILLFVAAFRDGKYFFDYKNYENFVNNFTFSFSSFLGNEIGFIAITVISNVFTSPEIYFFFIFALVSLLIKFHALNKGADNFYFALFALVCIFYLPHELTQIRVSVAAGFFMLAYVYILKGNKKLFYLNCLLAFCFHFSALILFPLYFILRCKYRYNMFFLFLPILGFFLHLIEALKLVINFFIENSPLIISTKLRIYHALVLDGEILKINLFNAQFLLFLSLFLLFTIPQLSNKVNSFHDNRLVITWRLISLSIFCYFSFSYITVFAFRSYELLSVPIVLSLYSLVKYYKQKLILKTILVSVLVLYFLLNFSMLIVV